MLVALVLGVIIGCTWWSWYYHRVVLATPAKPGSQTATTAPPGDAPLTPAPDDHAAAPIGMHQIEQLDDRSATSVLGWEAFSIASTLLLEGTVLVSCTRQSGHPATRGRLGHDGCLVLLLGSDDQAARAFDLIEQWRIHGTILRLRPTSLASAIELYDRRDNALRADLLAY